MVCLIFIILSQEKSHILLFYTYIYAVFKCSFASSDICGGLGTTTNTSHAKGLSATIIGMISIRNKKRNHFALIAYPQRINSAFRNIVGFCILNFTLSMLSNDFAAQISMQSLLNLFIHFVRLTRPIRNEIETYRIGYPQRLNIVLDTEKNQARQDKKCSLCCHRNL